MELFLDYLPLIIVFGPLIVFWILMRNKATLFPSPDGLDSVVGTGKPTVLKFFKNT